MNVLDAIRLRQPEEFRDALLIGQSLTAPEKMRQESSSGAPLSRTGRAHDYRGQSPRLLHDIPCLARRRHNFLTQHGTIARRHYSHAADGPYPVPSSSDCRAGGVLHTIGSGDELGSAWSTTLRPLLLYLDPHVAASTDRSPFTLDDLQYGTEALSLYLLAESSATPGHDVSGLPGHFRCHLCLIWSSQAPPLVTVCSLWPRSCQVRVVI